jgi:glycosyltransferase involved in cell wall biosynthesis
MDNRTISIAIPTYNRYRMTMDAINAIAFDERVSEVVISDDASTDNSYEELKTQCSLAPKVKFFQNEANQDCYWNKRIAIEHCTNDWCILLDSDNIIDTTYLDKLFNIPEWKTDTIYTPSFAKPHFDFRAFAGVTIHRNNVAQLMTQFPNMEVCLNAANYFVNREEYILCFDASKDPVTSDSIFTCYNWLHSGNQIHVLPGLEYEHRIHEGSHYQKNVNRTPAGFHQEILHKLSQL